MKHRWIEDIEEFQDISEEWDRSLIESAVYNPFLLSDFITTWWKHFGTGLQLRVFVIYDDNKIIGGLPLYSKCGGMKEGFAKILRYIGDGTANYTEPFYLEKREGFLSLLRDALLERSDWDVLCLSDVRSEAKRFLEVPESFSKELLFYITTDHFNWAIDLSSGIDDYYAKFSKKLKRDLRSKRRYISENYGELNLEQVKGEERIEECFRFYADFSKSSFSARNRKSAFNNDRYSNFFNEFLITMDKKDRLDAHILSAGGKVLAISFGYRFGKGFNWVLTGFNHEYKYARPGYILIEELIKETIKRGDDYYNWYGYERFYKGQWCNKKEPLFKFVVANKTVSGLSYCVIGWTKEKIRSNDFILRLIRRIRKQ